MAAYNYFNYGTSSAHDNMQINTHRYTRNDIRTAENKLSPTDSFTNSKVMLATNIFIYSAGAIIGMIQSFQVSESRTIDKIQAIGWEGVVQAVPHNTKGGQLQIQRIALYDSTLYNALGLNTQGDPHNLIGSLVHEGAPSSPAQENQHGWDQYKVSEYTNGPEVSKGFTFRTLKDQRTPLEIQVRTRMKGNGDSFYVTTYIDCWLSQYSKPYSVSDIKVTEQATMMYGDVY